MGELHVLLLNPLPDWWPFWQHVPLGDFGAYMTPLALWRAYWSVRRWKFTGTVRLTYSVGVWEEISGPIYIDPCNEDDLSVVWSLPGGVYGEERDLLRYALSFGATFRQFDATVTDQDGNTSTGQIGELDWMRRVCWLSRIGNVGEPAQMDAGATKWAAQEFFTSWSLTLGNMGGSAPAWQSGAPGTPLYADMTFTPSEAVLLVSPLATCSGTMRFEPALFWGYGGHVDTATGAEL